MAACPACHGSGTIMERVDNYTGYRQPTVCPMCEDEPKRCFPCGALVDDDGYSIDERACHYCKAD